MRHTLTVILTLLLAATATGQPAPTVEQMLADYAKAGRQLRFERARALEERFAAADVFFTLPPALRPDMPRDTLDALTWYGAACYFICTGADSLQTVYAQRAIPLLRDHYKHLHAHLLVDLGRIRQAHGDFVEAVAFSTEAVALCQSIGDERELSRAYTTLSYVNTNLKQGQEAINYIDKAIDANRRSGDTLLIHNLLGAACEAYCEVGDYERSIDYGKQSVAAARHRGSSPPIVANHLSQLGYAYYLADSLTAADRVLSEAFAMLEADGNAPRELVICCQKMSFVKARQKAYDKAADYLRKGIAICRSLGQKRDECNLQRTLFQTLRGVDAQGAVAAMDGYLELRDSVFNEEMQAEVARSNAAFRNDQLQKANATARQMNRIILITSLIVIILLVAMVASLVYAMRQRGRSNRMLKQLQAMRDRFFTNVAHEFRTPLTVILGMSRQLQDHEPATAAPAAGKLIEQQGSRLLELVNQLLDLTKLQTAPMLKPAMVTQNVVGQIEMVVEGFRGLAQQKDVTLTYTPAEREVVMDYVPDYLTKILTNLLSNAVKFTGSGGSVRVTTTQTADLFRLTVSDTGCGIPQGQLPYIFDAFYQVETPGLANAGTGIGLSLVRQLVEAVGAKISVDSTPGVGTTFTVDFPYVRPKQAPDLQAVPYIDVKASAAGDGPALTDADMADDQRTRVLVVEDNAAVAYYIGSILSPRYDVFYAVDGELGLHKARMIVPDLVVTDLMMPRMDGLELCRRLREDELTSHVPVIVITAKTTESDRLEGLQAGADAYLTKPFNAQELLIRVEKLLEQRRLLREKFSQQMAQHAKAVGEGRSGAAAQTAGADSDRLGLDVPTRLDQEFLEKVDALILMLMPRGEADLEHVAAQLFMHPPTFRRKIMALTGTPPAQYIMRFRMEQACKQLMDYPNVTISEVAERCGFADGAHFAHVFRRFYDTTPLQWAKSRER